MASLDCGRCLRVIYDLQRGVPRLDPNGKEFPRPPGTKPPCGGCPKGPIPFVKGWTEENRAAYVHYRQCKAVGRFPDDPIVARTAYLVSELEETLERSQMIETLATLKGGA